MSICDKRNFGRQIEQFILHNLSLCLPNYLYLYQMHYLMSHGMKTMPVIKKTWTKPLVKIISVKKDTFSGTLITDFEKTFEPDRLRP